PQPMKMAASEGLWGKSGDPAPWTVVANIDPGNMTSTHELKIPYALSFLSYSKFSGEVKGMIELQDEYVQKYGPGNYIPPVRTTFWSFRIMIVAGMAMIFITLWAVYLMWRKKFDQPNTRFMRICLSGLVL
ncbi:cytochrome ubiquinol oxidase subunit I, partial [Paenibacillus zanthoxyli]|uniref:cytochrome ubiquinol oxidase subunit I n=1 Tax=Paenibacillus zanthoxyli TaxID=369399 RepID=UPI0018DB29F3